jgi:DNA polymerase III delta prime subunit
LAYNSLQVKQLKDWLESWEQVHNHPAGGKKKVTTSSKPKAALLSGDPGIGKTTAARLVCDHLGFHALEVNAPQRLMAFPLDFPEGKPTCVSLVFLCTGSAWCSNTICTAFGWVLALSRNNLLRIPYIGLFPGGKGSRAVNVRCHFVSGFDSVLERCIWFLV